MAGAARSNWQDAPLVCRGPGRDTGSALDSYGRDLLSRLLYGARPALGPVALVTAITPARRSAGGYLSGYSWRVAGADTDALYRRGDVDAAPDPRLRVRGDARPGAGQRRAGVSPDHTWPAYARQARSGIQRLRHSDYLAAAEDAASAAGGCRSGHICRCVCRVGALSVWRSIWRVLSFAAAGLGFLGLGARPPMAEWGAMIADGMQVIFDQWWIAAIPGAAILLASLAFNLLGDGLRDILEPQHD